LKKGADNGKKSRVKKVEAFRRKNDLKKKLEELTNRTGKCRTV